MKKQIQCEILETPNESDQNGVLSSFISLKKPKKIEQILCFISIFHSVFQCERACEMGTTFLYVASSFVAFEFEYSLCCMQREREREGEQFYGVVQTVLPSFLFD